MKVGVMLCWSCKIWLGFLPGCVWLNGYILKMRIFLDIKGCWLLVQDVGTTKRRRRRIKQKSMKKRRKKKLWLDNYLLFKMTLITKHVLIFEITRHNKKEINQPIYHL